MILFRKIFFDVADSSISKLNAGYVMGNGICVVLPSTNRNDGRKSQGQTVEMREVVSPFWRLDQSSGRDITNFRLADS